MTNSQSNNEAKANEYYPHYYTECNLGGGLITMEKHDTAEEAIKAARQRAVDDCDKTFTESNGNFGKGDYQAFFVYKNDLGWTDRNRGWVHSLKNFLAVRSSKVNGGEMIVYED